MALRIDSNESWVAGQAARIERLRLEHAVASACVRWRKVDLDGGELPYPLLNDVCNAVDALIAHQQGGG